MISVKILMKSLIVWFLLLAVPFQGFASATMLFCAPMQPTASAPSSAASPQHHDHHAMLESQHAGHDHRQMSHADAATAQDADHASTAADHSGSKCNSCAACCFGASMPPSVTIRIAVDAQHVTAVPATTGFIPAVELALPERPPQASLA